MSEKHRELLERVDRYLDAAPRADCDAEQVGTFTLFRSRSPWSYYARPRFGRRAEFHPRDVETLAARCAELRLATAIEWVGEIAPTLRGAASEAGLEVQEFSLLVLERPQAPAALDCAVELLSAHDPRLTSARAVADVSFTAGGTDPGAAGAAERDAREREISERVRDHLHRRASDGLTITAAAVDDCGSVLAAGALQPAAGAGEIVGVATLPAHRRRGLAAAVTWTLIEHARRLALDPVLLSAQNERVEQLYRSLGFRRIGSALAAEGARR